MIKFKIFGVYIGVSVGFLGILSFMLYIDKTGLMLITLQATLFHEMGHALMMYWLGYGFEKIELKIGAVAICGKFNHSLKSETLIALAGPLFNFLFFSVYLAVNCFFNAQLLYHALVMLVIGVFHMLPINGLDGGTVLKNLLLKRLSYKTACSIVNIVSLVFIFGLIAFGIVVLLDTRQNPSLVFLGLYLLFGFFVGKNQKQ